MRTKIRSAIQHDEAVSIFIQFMLANHNSRDTHLITLSFILTFILFCYPHNAFHAVCELIITSLLMGFGQHDSVMESLSMGLTPVSEEVQETTPL